MHSRHITEELRVEAGRKWSGHEVSSGVGALWRHLVNVIVQTDCCRVASSCVNALLLLVLAMTARPRSRRTTVCVPEPVSHM